MVSVLLDSLLNLAIIERLKGNPCLLVEKFKVSGDVKRILIRLRRDFNLLFFGLDALVPLELYIASALEKNSKTCF